MEERSLKDLLAVGICWRVMSTDWMSAEESLAVWDSMGKNTETDMNYPVTEMSD